MTESTKPRRFLTKTRAERDVWELAVERVANIFNLFDHVAVGFSGGKDSTVVLELCMAEAERRGRLPLDVVHYDEEAIPLETEEYIRRRANDPRLSLRWYCIPLKHRNAASRTSPYWYPWDPEAKDIWVRPMPPEGLTTLDGFVPRAFLPKEMHGMILPPHLGTCAWVLGIRAAESMMRTRAVMTRAHDNYINRDYAAAYSNCPYCPPEKRGLEECRRHVMPAGHVHLCYPIYDWTVDDVWTAPKLFGWDYNRGYDLMDKAGISSTVQRIAPAFGEEPLANLWMFKECFPDMWEKMCVRVPGAATAARYSRSVLYGFGGTAKAADVEWQDHIRKLLMKWPEKQRLAIARNISEVIAMHHNQTSEPILPQAKHPVTGVSWRMLERIAMRGNLKRRLTSMYSANARQKYDAERAREGV